MTSENIAAPFMRLPIFHGLSDQRLSRIARAAERVVFQPGDTIQRSGESADAAILIVSGKAVIVETDAALWQVHGEPVVAGSLVGELAMLIDTQSTTTVIARSSVRAFRIPRDALRSLMETDPAIADHFVGKLSERLSILADEMRRIDGLLESSFVPPAGMHRAAEVQPHVH